MCDVWLSLWPKLIPKIAHITSPFVARFIVHHYKCGNTKSALSSTLNSKCKLQKPANNQPVMCFYHVYVATVMVNYVAQGDAHFTTSGLVVSARF